MRIALAVVLILAAALTSHAQLTLELRSPLTGVLGEAIPLHLLFTNRGDEATYLHFSGVDYGPESLVVCAAKDGQWHATGSIHFDRNEDASRFDFVSLRPKHAFEAPILGINDPVADALPILLLTRPGKYKLFVKYRSAGPTSLGLLWPIWRGTVTSPVQELTLVVPSHDAVASRRSALQVCAADADACDSSSVNYFRTVPDALAAKTLVLMLDAVTFPDPVLMAAVENQQGDGPRAALLRFAARFPGHAALLDQRADDSAAICAQASLNVQKTPWL